IPDSVLFRTVLPFDPAGSTVVGALVACREESASKKRAERREPEIKAAPESERRHRHAPCTRGRLGDEAREPERERETGHNRRRAQALERAGGERRDEQRIRAPRDDPGANSLPAAEQQLRAPVD